MCNKAGRQVNALQRLKGTLDSETRLTIYKSFILSQFNYCTVLWMFTGNKQLKKIDRLQQRSLRFVLKEYKSSCSLLLQTSKVTTIRRLCLNYLSNEMYKCIMEYNPDYLNHMFTLKDTKYGLRNSYISIPKVKTTRYGLKSLKYYGAKIWNMIPEDIKRSQSLPIFKERIKLWNRLNCICTICSLYVIIS